MATVEELVARLQALGFAPGEATNEGVATVVAEPGPTRTAIDARVTGVGDTRYVPLFQPLTAYLAGALAVLPAPTNALGTRITDGTSRAAFDATEQALWATAAGGYDGGTL